MHVCAFNQATQNSNTEQLERASFVGWPLSRLGLRSKAGAQATTLLSIEHAMVSLSLYTFMALQACFLVSASPYCSREAYPSEVLFGKHAKRPGPKPPALAAWNCAETHLNDLQTALNCLFQCRVPLPRAQIMWSNNTDICPEANDPVSQVTLNKLNPTGPVLVTMQSDASPAKDATYYSVTNTSKILHASQWVTLSLGSFTDNSAMAFAGPLAVIGYPYEDRQRDAVVNGTEAGATTTNVGAALLHSGVFGDDNAAHVAAQTVLAHPPSPVDYKHGSTAAVVELVAAVVYHVAVAAVSSAEETTVHMYRVEQGGGGVGWGGPVITVLSNLTAPWAWGSSLPALAARHATDPGGLPAALVVGIGGDAFCGATSAWPATCPYSGSAHVYTLDMMSGVWVWRGALKAPVVKAFAVCGNGVAIAGALVAVGCYGDSSPSTLVDVGEDWTNDSYVGAAHAWRLDPGANASESVREGYLKAFAAAGWQSFAWAVAIAVNATHEVVAAGAIGSWTGAPYGDMAAGLAMPYDVPVSGSGESAEGEVWTFVHAVGGGGVGTWRVAHRIKPPAGLGDENVGVTLSAVTMPSGEIVLGLGTSTGCRGYLVVVP